jgi:hypothetical protein
MWIFAVISLTVGIHIIFVRAYTAKVSKINEYLLLGLFEGIPLLCSSILLILEIQYSFICFVLAFAFYFSVQYVRPIKKEISKENPEKWNDWENKKATINILKRIFLLLP